MGAVGDKCPFCLPATGRLAFVGPLTKGIWDAFPVTEGHLLLVPHRHVAAWAELAAEEQAELVADIGRAQSLLQEKFAPDGFNVGFNVGKAGGQTIPHFHIHVIPRRNGDMPDPRGGVRHVIPTKGNYLATAPFEPAKSIVGLPHDRSLIAGDEDELLLHLVPYIDGAITAHIKPVVWLSARSQLSLRILKAPAKYYRATMRAYGVIVCGRKSRACSASRAKALKFIATSLVFSLDWRANGHPRNEPR